MIPRGGSYFVLAGFASSIVQTAKRKPNTHHSQRHLEAPKRFQYATRSGILCAWKTELRSNDSSPPYYSHTCGLCFIHKVVLAEKKSFLLYICILRWALRRAMAGRHCKFFCGVVVRRGGGLHELACRMFATGELTHTKKDTRAMSRKHSV